MTPVATWRRVAAPYLTGEAIPTSARHNALLSLAGRLRFEGHEQDVIEAVLLEINRVQCVPPKDPREVEKIARWAGEKPAVGRELVPRAEFDAVREIIVELTHAVEDSVWRGHGAATDRDVVCALLQIGFRCGRLAFPASEREIAELAAVSRPAAHRALTKSGAVRKWVRRIPDRGSRRATNWQLRVGPVQGFTNQALITVMGLVKERTPGDEWRHHGLGKNARHVWNALAAQPWPSVSELARACKMVRQTATRALERLAEHGLAVHGAAGWCRGSVDPEDIAPLLRSYGAGERQRQLHAYEREVYDEARARRARRRGRGRVLVLSPTEARDEPGMAMAA